MLTLTYTLSFDNGSRVNNIAYNDLHEARAEAILVSEELELDIRITECQGDSENLIEVIEG